MAFKNFIVFSTGYTVEEERSVGDTDDKIARMGGLFIPKVAWIFPLKCKLHFQHAVIQPTRRILSQMAGTSAEH